MTSDLLRLIALGGPVMWPLLGLSLAIWFGLGWRAVALGYQRLAAPATVRDWALRPRVALPGRGLQPLLCLAWRRDPRPAALAVAMQRAHLLLGGPSLLLRALIQAAPLLGLLGTVTGMIALFDALSATGVSRPGLLSAGIAQALLTTQVGLLVAVPALYVERRLSRRQAAIDHGLEQTRLALLQIAAPPAPPATAKGEVRA